MKWYYAHGGSQKGPVDGEELRAKIASGEVAKSDLVWREGMKDWVPVSDVAELSSYAPEPSPSVSVPEVHLDPTAQVQPPVSAQPSAAPVSPYQAPQSAPGGGVSGPIPNYLWQSILVTVLCCWPFGIPAIVYAAKVDGLVARGQYAEARDASDKAKMWTGVALGCWIVGFVLYVILILIGVANSQ